MEIIPAILEEDFSEIEKKLKTYSNLSKTVHIDFIDGVFAENKTFLTPAPFLSFANIFNLEAHLMVSEPIKYLDPLAGVGFKRFLGHIEKMPDQEEFAAQAQLLGEVGLAIDGPTDLSVIKVPYEDLDCILVMTIKAGQSGQMFNPKYLKKVEMLKQVQHDIGIEVDGGINDQTILFAKLCFCKLFSGFIALRYIPDFAPSFWCLKVPVNSA